MRQLLRALNYLKRHWLIATGALFSLLISTGASLATPQLAQRIIDQGISTGSMAAVVGGAFGMVALSIVERGTHEELLATQGRYYEIYNSQFRRQPAGQLAEAR